jgi:hypothetical protein
MTPSFAAMEGAPANLLKSAGFALVRQRHNDQKVKNRLYYLDYTALGGTLLTV